MSKVRYPEQIKIEAVKQVTKVGFSVAEVVNRLGTTTYSLYAWIQRYGPEAESFAEFSAESSEILRLRKELKRVTEERNLLKSRGVFRKPPRLRYAFIRDHSANFPIRGLCNLFYVYPNGYYAWLKGSNSKLAKENEQLTALVKQLWLESGCVYDYRKIYQNLRSLNESCGINRVHYLMRRAGLKAQMSYCKPRAPSGATHAIASNVLERQFDPEIPKIHRRLQILRILEHMKAGCTYPWCSISIHVE